MNRPQKSSVGALTIAGIVCAACASAAEKSPTEIVPAPMVKPLEAAQLAIRRMNWPVALDDLEQAQATKNKTPQAEYTVDDLLAYVLYRQNKYAEAAEAYERLLQSPLMPAAEINGRMKTIAELYYRLGNYLKAVYWAKKCLAADNDQPQLEEMLGDSYFRMNDYKNTAATMMAAVSRVEALKQTPKESWLRLIDDSYYRLGDIQGMKRALLKLVYYYQRPRDWSELIDLYSQDVHDPHITFEFRRLMFDLDLLKRPGDYESMVFEALGENVPAVADQVLERAKQDQVFAGPDTFPGQYEHLMALVQKQLAPNRAKLSKLAQEATRSATGKDAVLAGQIYLSYGDYDHAVDSLTRGIAKGGLEDIDGARLDLGIAYWKQGQRQLADQAFNAIAKDSKSAALAELWALRIHQAQGT